MKRHTAAALLILSSCGAPEDALVSRCTNEVLSLFTECELHAIKLKEPRSSYVDANTKNEKVSITATFSVVKGTVTVVIPGCAEGGTAEVRAGQSAAVQCEARINPRTYRFEVEARPGDGGAEGFAAKLSFKAI